MRPARLAFVLTLLVLFAATLPASAAMRRGADPDWPCAQRLVPALSAATFWSGPDPTGAGDWTREPRVSELVRRITPRRVTAEAGEQAIAAFAEAIGSGEDRANLLTLAFAGLLEETNRERSALIERLKALGHRQNELADLASKATEELGRIPENAVGDEATRRQDLQQRFTFVTRAYEGGRQTLRYACDAPVQLEARLGRYARSLQSHL
jgi:hypothetical protein